MANPVGNILLVAVVQLSSAHGRVMISYSPQGLINPMAVKEISADSDIEYHQLKSSMSTFSYAGFSWYQTGGMPN